MAISPAMRSRLSRSAPALGGAPLGNLFQAIPEDVAIALVRYAYVAGARYFDTAPHYGLGLSERRMGAALGDVPRDSFLLSTKVGRLLTPASDAPSSQYGYVDVPPFVQHYDYTGSGALRSIEDSLRRMGLSRIDFVFVHDVDAATHGQDFARHFAQMLDGALPALARLKSEGTIGGYGLGVNDVEICRATLRHADLDVILLAGRYTLADQSALPELLPECSKRDVAIVLGGPFNSGILASGSRPSDGGVPYFNYAPAYAPMIAHVRTIESVCAQFKVPLKAAALQFPLAHPAVACVLPGARSRSEFDDNAAMARIPIPQEFWQALRTLALVNPLAPLPARVAEGRR
ncbi:MAG: aldo/keto reductase [Betaproteobacteria bacterium]